MLARLAERAAPRPRHRRRRLLAALAAALVLLPAAAAVALPDARDDVLEWLGLRNVTVRRVPAPPPSTRPELEADLGRTVSLAQAERDAGFRPALPAALGEPDRVRVVDGRISLLYGPRPGLPELSGVRAGLILTEARGGIHGPYLRKLVLAGSDVERVEVARPHRGVTSPAARTSTCTRRPAARSARSSRCSPGRR